MAEPTLDFTVRDRAAYLPAVEALVLADLHLGKIESSRLMLPSDEVSSLVGRLKTLVDEFDPSSVVVAGDILHDFGSVPRSVESSLTTLHEDLSDLGVEVIFVKGNHDTLLETQLDPVEAYACSDGTVVCHGHVEPTIDGSRYLIGHEHPAIRISGQRKPCYLYGESVYRGADVLALPAFSGLITGTPINNLRGADLQSPLLADLDEFKPMLYDEAADETLVFPRLREFRGVL